MLLNSALANLFQERMCLRRRDAGLMRVDKSGIVQQPLTDCALKPLSALSSARPPAAGEPGGAQ